MRLLRRMLFQQFLPIFSVALVFFVLLLQLIDVFSSIWRYFAHDVAVSQVAWIALLYVPKCISFALPVSFLFAVANDVQSVLEILQRSARGSFAFADFALQLACAVLRGYARPALDLLQLPLEMRQLFNRALDFLGEFLPPA